MEQKKMTESEMLRWLSEQDSQKLERLFKEARACAVRFVGPKVYFRGLIEFSNICVKDCYYCGIRKGNHQPKRFSMNEEEILRRAQTAFEMGYGSIVLQSGERQDPDYVLFIEALVKKIKSFYAGQIGITLSLGEQQPETYERWFHAGAHRYLLRIETSNRNLYQKLHPENHSFETRLRCLENLREIGYQTGTGVMIGLPFQTREDLAKDILFFKDQEIDMIGMGPYIPHANTPLSWPEGDYDAEDHFRLALVMISLTRFTIPDINIAATTALQALHPWGREKGILAGANIIMPNMTPLRYRSLYQLYDNKPCLDEDADQCRGCLEKRLEAAGVEIGYGEWGDSLHFYARNRNFRLPGSRFI